MGEETGKTGASGASGAAGGPTVDRRASAVNGARHGLATGASGRPRGGVALATRPRVPTSTASPAPRPAAPAPFRPGRRELLSWGLTIAIAATAAVLHHAGAPPVARFVAAAAALSLLAKLVGDATDHLGERLNPGATGVLQSALGNLPELFVCLFSLRAGLVDVVRAALVGSILANSVLVLGLAILAGGLKHGTQRFGAAAPRMTATLMLLAVTALAVPTLAHELHTPAQAHEATFSALCAVVLLVVFAASLPFSLAADPVAAATPVTGRAAPSPRPGAAFAAEGRSAAQRDAAPAGAGAPVRAHAAWPLAVALGVLAFAAVAAAFVSEWFVDALLPATAALGLSPAFTGLVIVAIAGNAVENVVGIQLALRDKPDYAMSVILNSSLQIALALTPVLVLASFFIGPTPLTLVLQPLLVVALALSGLVGAFVVFDGESVWLEGVALVGLYVMLAGAFWWG